VGSCLASSDLSYLLSCVHCLTDVSMPGAGSKVVERFRLLGRAMAKALQDSRLLDIPLSYTFYRCDCRPSHAHTLTAHSPCLQLLAKCNSVDVLQHLLSVCEF
jgi:hypothetical protein